MDDPTEQPDDDAAGPGLDRHRADEAIYQGFDPPPMQWGPGSDGMPELKTQGSLPIVAPLSPKTLVCMADTSSFVVRDRWGAVVAEFEPGDVDRAPDGTWFVPLKSALGKVPLLSLVGRLEPASRRVRVEPRRPQCRYMRRQMTDFQDDPDHHFVERLCTARRDSESFFLTVRDSQYHACELREPRDPESERRLDRFDAIKVKLGAERIRELGITDADTSLDRAEKEANRGLEYGGIFNEKKE